MRATILVAVCILGLLSVWLGDIAFSDKPAKTIRILFIGNSYTRGIVGAQKVMLDELKIPASVEYVAPGGKTLDWHVNHGSLDKVRSGNYDIVVLQEQSQTPAIFNLRPMFFAACKRAVAAARASGAKPVLYMTWGHRDGDRQNPHIAPTYEKMQALLSEGYLQVARETQAEIAPVGEVWAAIRRGNEELAKSMYVSDGSHPSELGAFVTAMTFSCHLFGCNPYQIKPPASLKLSDNQLRQIRAAVAETQ